MKYDVTRFGPGGFDVITVEADTGDEAVLKAFKPGTTIRGVTPSDGQGEPAKKRGRPAAQGDEA